MTQLYTRDVRLLANPGKCVRFSVYLVRISRWLRDAGEYGERGSEAGGPRGGMSQHPQCHSRQRAERHLAGSLAWAATLAAAQCPEAPLPTASTAVGSSRCSCPEASPGRDRTMFSCQHQWWTRHRGRYGASSGLLSLLASVCY